MAETKAPGRIRDILNVLGMVLRHSPLNWVWLALGTLLPLGIGIALAGTVAADIVGVVIWVIMGILLAALGFLIVLGRLTQRLMYSNLEGQIGAVSALIKNQLRRSWRGSEVPVRMNKAQDTVYRVVGRPGVVIISEGQRARVAPLVDEVRREVGRIVPGIAIHVLHVGVDGLAIKDLFPTMYKIKGATKTAEILVVSNRLASIAKDPMSAVPKGIDPRKVRAGRPR